MKRLLTVLLCLLLPATAFASSGVDAARRSEQASMIVTGLIAINPSGSVYGYSLDHRDKLPADVIKLINQTLSGWIFDPIMVGGKPVLAKALMSLRIVAYQTSPGHYVASIAGADFGDDAAQTENPKTCLGNTCRSYNPKKCPDNTCWSYNQFQPPKYPMIAAQNGVGGTVYLTLEINRQGRVAQAAVAQVDLQNFANDDLLKVWRHELGEASLKAARGWTFNVPETAKSTGKTQWIVQVPVVYSLMYSNGEPYLRHTGYGQWYAYVPGPVHPIPWAQGNGAGTASNGSADAIPNDGAPFVPDSRFVLLTPIGKPASNPRATGGSSQG